MGPFRLNGPCFLSLFFLFLFLQSSYKSTLALREKRTSELTCACLGLDFILKSVSLFFFSVFFSFYFFALVFCPFVGSAVIADQSRSARSKRSQVEEPNQKRNGVAFVSFRLVEHVTFNVYSHRLMLKNTKWPLGSFSVLLTHTDTLCARLTMTSTTILGRPSVHLVFFFPVRIFYVCVCVCIFSLLVVCRSHLFHHFGSIYTLIVDKSSGGFGLISIRVSDKFGQMILETEGNVLTTRITKVGEQTKK